MKTGSPVRLAAGEHRGSWRDVLRKLQCIGANPASRKSHWPCCRAARRSHHTKLLAARHSSQLRSRLADALPRPFRRHRVRKYWHRPLIFADINRILLAAHQRHPAPYRRLRRGRSRRAVCQPLRDSAKYSATRASVRRRLDGFSKPDAVNERQNGGDHPADVLADTNGRGL